MMKVATYLFICVMLVSVISLAEDKPPKVGDVAPDFTLQDAEEKQHNLKKLRGKLVLLIMGNRKIRKEDDKWAEAFQKDYKDNEQVTAYIIADMRSVPGFIPKGFIRSRIKRKPPPVTFLMDWKGQVHQRYRTEKKKPNLYLISSQGKIVFHRKANFKPEIYMELKKQIDTLLAEKP
ncbi:redoxin domain-containing protein [Candidatus Poribacteria bacterium]|nr:redoxin domain-containing protein [Candidatus Poribacteria bacterium]